MREAEEELKKLRDENKLLKRLVHQEDLRIPNDSPAQDESYYILQTGPEAKTYLGLKEDADVSEFRQAAKKSEKQGVPLDYEKYVNSIPTKPGDYFLIPAGTIHASGKNQVVLEIDGGIAAFSPGYTFHIYD
ncbi:MAG: hypothetical protein QXX79_07660, partial [Candidatus Bathyarchaeia archaeon]